MLYKIQSIFFMRGTLGLGLDEGEAFDDEDEGADEGGDVEPEDP